MPHKHKIYSQNTLSHVLGLGRGGGLFLSPTPDPELTPGGSLLFLPVGLLGGLFLGDPILEWEEVEGMEEVDSLPSPSRAR